LRAGYISGIKIFALVGPSFTISPLVPLSLKVPAPAFLKARYRTPRNVWPGPISCHTSPIVPSSLSIRARRTTVSPFVVKYQFTSRPYVREDRRSDLGCDPLLEPIEFFQRVGRPSLEGIPPRRADKPHPALALEKFGFIRSHQVFAGSIGIAITAPPLMAEHHAIDHTGDHDGHDLHCAPKKAPQDAHGPFQHILTHVKPERDQNRRAVRRNNWWLFGENAPTLRRGTRGL
jgi:hypothetical protein